MTLEIISAHDVAFRGEVSSVTLPGELGSFTVLNNHAPIISVLVKGSLKYVDDKDKVEILQIEGGLADVNNNVISVCIY